MSESPTYEELEKRVRELESAERQLSENEDKFARFFQSSPVILVISSIDNGEILEVNDTFEKASGYRRCEVIGRSAHELNFWPEKDDRGRFVNTIEQQGAIRNLEMKFRVRSGEIRDMLLSSEIIRVAGQDRLISTLADISDRKIAEEAFRESERRFRELANSLPQIVFESDENGRISFANKNAFEMFALPEGCLEKGINILQMIIPEDRDRAVKNIRRIFEGKKVDEDYIALRHDGSTFPVSIHTNRIMRNNKPVGMRGILVDLTERKHSEKERLNLLSRLRRAEKMEAIGTLAGGVAHDLNNILSGIVSYPDLLLMRLPEDSPMTKPLHTIREAGKKAAAIVQDLLTLARRGVVNEEVIGLNELISGYLKSPEFSILTSYHPGMEVETELETDLLNVSGSHVHLSKTIMNLVSNAAEAMPEGGIVRIKTENIYIDLPVGNYDEVVEGEYVVLTVSDSGTGISGKDMERIFEPFFTRKKMGRSGTGLGMAVVWGTVKDHRGYIDVQSIEGEGTAIRIYLPVTREVLRRRDPGLSVQELMGNGEKILVVDDMKEQREIAHGILSELGYSADSVSSGEQAIEYIRKNTADLVILDMIMDPGIDGLDTYKRILELKPGQKAVITSGFSETARVKKAQEMGAGQYVKKPYSLENIGNAIKKELGLKHTVQAHTRQSL